MRRRGNREGSIYQIRDGRWRAAVVLTDGRRKYVSAATREEVAKKLRLLQRLTDDRLPVSTDGRAPTLESWLVHWLDHIAAARVRPSTLEGYRSKVRTRIVPTLGHFRFDGLQPDTSRPGATKCSRTASRRPVCCSASGYSRVP